MRALKWIFGLVGGLFLVGIVTLLFVWSFPEAILTSERVSGWVAPLVRFERAKEDGFPNAPMITLQIGKDGFTRRSLNVRLAPGCYSLAHDPEGGTSACVTVANFGISFRLDRKNFFRLTGLDQIELRVSRGRFVAAPDTSKSEEPKEKSSDGFPYLRYLDRDFAWGPITIQVDEFTVPAAKMLFAAKIETAEKDFRGKNRSPRLAVKATADAPDFFAGVEGELFQENGDTLILPNSSISYRTKSKDREETTKIAGELNARYSLATGDLDAGFSVNWKAPTPEIESLRAENGIVRMRADELSARSSLKLILRGKTPLGRLPVLTIDAGATLLPIDKNGSRPIDLDIVIDAYEFAGVRAKSDLAVTIVAKKDQNEIRWRKGELKVEVPDFATTVKNLAKTPWAIPVPFNVFSGPITIKTEPFRDLADHTTVPATLSTKLKSMEQILDTETKIEIDVAKKNFAISVIRVAAAIRKIQFRLPDYEPLAPTPALARDSRIIRYGKPAAPEVKPATVIAAPTAKETAILLSVKAPPESVVLLNRFFSPNFAASIDLETDAETQTFRGTVALSRVFDLKYLNRSVRLERIDIRMRPEIEVDVRVSMERAGYTLFAELHQSHGKTQIDLSSNPPLEDSEIVSLLLYGMPGNSISSEQTRSVGSAQAAMGSEALGLFSFWAFASTPIESVLYDPETQTYSAVVKLPGGVVASIGSNWDNERQVALSKSLGRNWAVSTELIRDAQGVDRGGTLLRWRKSY